MRLYGAYLGESDASDSPFNLHQKTHYTTNNHNKLLHLPPSVSNQVATVPFFYAFLSSYISRIQIFTGCFHCSLGLGIFLIRLFGFSPISFAMRISSSFNRHFFFASAQSSGLYAILHLPFFLKVRPFILPLESPLLIPYAVCQDSSDRHLHGSDLRTGL